MENRQIPDLNLIKKTHLKKGIKIHLIVYLSINAFFIIIEFLMYYFLYISLVSIFFWGLGLALHTGIALIKIKYDSSEDQTIRIQILIYIIVFIIISIFLISLTGDVILVLILAILSIYFWINYYISYYFYKKKSNVSDNDDLKLSRYDQSRLNYIAKMSSINVQEANQKANNVTRNQIGFRYHLFNYITTCAIFIIINIFSGSPSFWSFWIILTGGLAIMVHYYSANLVINRVLSQPINKFYWLLYPGTLNIYFLIIDLASGLEFYFFSWVSITTMILSLLIWGIVIIVKKSKMNKKNEISSIKAPPTLNLPIIENSTQISTNITKPNRKMYCPNCGSEYIQEENFCPFCASELPKD